MIPDTFILVDDIAECIDVYIVGLHQSEELQRAEDLVGVVILWVQDDSGDVFPQPWLYLAQHGVDAEGHVSETVVCPLFLFLRHWFCPL